MRDIHFVVDGSKVSGHLYIPKDSAKNKAYPCVILCHGFCGVKELLLPAFADYFANNGYAALTFDYRGFGQSEGEKGRLVPELQIEDIQQAIAYVSSLDEIDENKIALWGTSFGGANAIVAASNNSAVKCLTVQLTFADGERVITGNMTEEEKQKFLATIKKMQDKKAATGKEMMVPIAKVLSDEQSKAFYTQYADDYPALKEKIPFLTIAETINHKPEKYTQDIRVPVHITCAGKDAVNPPEESQILYDRISSTKELLMLEDATHYEVYEGMLFNKVAEAHLNWFQKHL
ncbi:alpha/beta hydrolase [Teredinibacter sp. KSP-S5-2]|uniref:UilS family quorum-quenching N-acyl-homoserine lactonase n=1 Tax=Teredinibacter sp. KSP-S5-2 TaxID=3034506 RepID=UPI002934268A|nr:alpha/beta fold hydrolase [Teredinibacter sp. KSP-S5-2]WNO07557.1 alpha/beta fold hydrolase [Teredinibacter sp. KSP-S5-2]